VVVEGDVVVEDVVEGDVEAEVAVGRSRWNLHPKTFAGPPHASSRTALANVLLSRCDFVVDRTMQ
jgi:hypothetical protein